MFVRIQAIGRGAMGTRLDCGSLQCPAPEFGFYSVADRENRVL